MSKLLRKFLQIVILPAALLVVSKVVGLYFAITFFNLEFFLETRPEQIYSIQLYFTNQADTILANSISNLAMFLTISLMTIYFLTKYRLSLLASYNPRVLVKLNNLNLMPWVTSKNNTFLKVFVWIMFLWVVCVTVIADVLSQSSFFWIAGLTFLITIMSTWILIRTFEIEGEIVYPHSKTSNLY
jgi:hypothetical protein